MKKNENHLIQNKESHERPVPKTLAEIFFLPTDFIILMTIIKGHLTCLTLYS